MKTSLKHYLFILTIFIYNISFGQSNHSLKNEWTLLSKSLKNRNIVINQFLADINIKKDFPNETKSIKYNVDSLTKILNSITIIDSISLNKIQSLNDFITIKVLEIGNNIQSQSKYKSERYKLLLKKLETQFMKVSFQTHDYNYWINELENHNLIFKSD